MSDARSTTDTSEGPACSLPAGEMMDRLARWKTVAQQAACRSAEPGRIVSTYPRSEELLRELRELIEAEAQCCTFLSFSLRERGEIIEAELRYPPEFEPVVSLIVPQVAATA